MYEYAERQTKKKCLQKAVGEELHRSVGMRAGLTTRDPITHLMQNFETKFEKSGRLAFANKNPEIEEQGLFFETTDEEPEYQRESEADEIEEYAPCKESPFMSKFADIAFHNGNLAAGIIEGKGKLMLVATLKNALGQTASNSQTGKTVGGAAEQRVIPGERAEVLFNRYDAKTAVGLVVSALRNSKGIVSAFESAMKSSDLQGIETLDVIMPFLCTKEDKSRKEMYLERLSELQGMEGTQEEREVLSRAIDKQAHIIDTKERLKAELAVEISTMMDNVTEAENMFVSPGFWMDVYNEVIGGDGDEDDEGDETDGDGEGLEDE